MLLLSLEVGLMTRRIRGRGGLSRAISPSNSLAAGDSQATFERKALLGSLLQGLMDNAVGLCVRQFAGDIRPRLPPACGLLAQRPYRQVCLDPAQIGAGLFVVEPQGSPALVHSQPWL
jgi:hypothetical protein